MAELKEKYGCKYVFNSTHENFFTDLTALAKELKATCLIECVGGSLLGKLLECLPSKSTLITYGCLSETAFSDIDPLLLIGRSYSI